MSLHPTPLCSAERDALLRKEWPLGKLTQAEILERVNALPGKAMTLAYLRVRACRLDLLYGSADPVYMNRAAAAAAAR